MRMECPYCGGEFEHTPPMRRNIETKAPKNYEFDGQKISARARYIIEHFKAENWVQLAMRYNHLEVLSLNNVGRSTRQEIFDCLRRHAS